MTASTENPQNKIKTFKFSFPTCTNESLLFNLEVPIEIPYDGCTRELVQRVINMFNIPVYLEEELNEKLADFVKEETKTFHNDRDDDLIKKLKNNEIEDIEGIVKNWEKLFKENVLEFADFKGTPDDEIFAAAYHKLVHSPALDTILQVESSYARTVAELLKNKNEDVKKITERQTEEMEEKMKHLNTFTTEQDINDLAAAHSEEQSLTNVSWGSQVDALLQAQRSQYRSWIMSTLDEYQGCGITTPSNSPIGTFTKPTSFPPLQPAPARLEESFTIHLGSQLKQTHNLRIVALDVMDLCCPDSYDAEPPNRIQTALNLYSSELSAVVVLCDAPSGFNPHLDRLAKAATEFHFLSLDGQLSQISERVKEPTEKRNLERLKEQSSGRTKPRRNLQTGDVYMTRHSNLAEVQVVFHLVVDDTLRSGDINSRHPAILGLRNILKTACSHDITNITIPLLLTHELTGDMTVSWCLRRAELVLKCVKGFMLEVAAGGGAELRALHVVVPTDGRGLFRGLVTALAGVFRSVAPRRL